MLVPVLLFAVGLVLLIKGGDWFVDGATGLARRFHIPEIIVGATVVSIGTTLPEVMVSATGALNGQGAMSYGNAIGSIICNTSLIAAITLAVRPARGLIIGSVVDAGYEETGVAKFALLDPAADINSLEQVFIITQYTTEVAITPVTATDSETATAPSETAPSETAATQATTPVG